MTFFPLALVGLLGGVLILAQTPSGIWNLQGSITVVGVLVVAVVALYLGLVTPKPIVEDLRTRLRASEEENGTLHHNLLEQVKANSELTGQIAALREEIASLRDEVRNLRRTTQQNGGGP